MTKPLEKNDIFADNPNERIKVYKNIVMLLALVPEGLEPKEILSFLADQKTLDRLQKQKKINYDYKREKEKVIEKLHKKSTEKYYKFIETGYITSPSQLSNKFDELINLNTIERQEKIIRITDDFRRDVNTFLFNECLRSYPFSQGKYSDANKLEQKKKDLLNAYSKLFEDFSQEEKKQTEEYLNDMKLTLQKICRIKLRKFQEKWNEELKMFHELTRSNKIKNALEKSPDHFFQIINMPFIVYTKLEENDFYRYTGLSVIYFLRNSNVRASKLKIQYDENEKKRGMIATRIDEISNLLRELKIQYQSKAISEEIYDMSEEKLLQECDIIKKDIEKYEEVKNKLRAIAENKIEIPEDEDINKKLSKKQLEELIIIPKLIYDEIEYIGKTFEKGKIYDFRRFSEIWSKYFFWEDYEFTALDIEEIVKWCWSKIGVVRDIYNSLTPAGRCEGYINDMLMGVSNELPFKPLIIK